MNRHTLTIITVLGLATGPSALFTGTALGFTGSPDARDANTAAQVKQYIDLGCTYFVPWCGDYPDDTSLRMLAEQVMPQFR